MKGKMRKLKICLAILLVAVISLCNSSFLYAKNVYADNIILPLITNDSFESDNGWQVDCISGTLDETKLNYVYENAYDGARYFALSDGEYLVKTTDFIDVDGGDNYVFGIKYISSSLDNSCKISVETFDSSNNLLSTITGEEKSPNLTDVWANVQVDLTASSNVAKVKLIIEIKATNVAVGIDYAYGNKDVIETLFGASIFLKEGNSGIRFTGRVDKVVYDGYALNSVSVGILLMPTNYLERVGEFTLKGVSSESGRAIIADKWANQNSADTDGYYEFNCAMQNMHVKEALTLKISARAFIKITIDGVEKYFYSDFDLEGNSRSIQGVAINLKADTETYNRFDSLQRSMIDAYALGELPR